MKHGITRRVLGDDTFLDISEDEYATIANAKSNLLHGLYIEEKFDIVLQNYGDVERELLSRAVGNVLFNSGGWSESIGNLHVFNRRLINLLRTCRLYLDQVVHNVHAIFGDASQLGADLKAKKRDEYDAHLGYRVLEAMRNYVQHRGFPVHRITLSGQRIGNGEDVSIRHVVIPEIDVRELKRDKKFKESVLTEIESHGPHIDVRPLIREYVASIGRIHEFVRVRLDVRLASDESTLANAETNFKQIGGENTVGLAAVRVDDNENTVEYVEIFDDFIGRRKELIRRNRNVSHYAWHFVTNEVERRDA